MDKQSIRYALMRLCDHIGRRRVYEAAGMTHGNLHHIFPGAKSPINPPLCKLKKAFVKINIARLLKRRKSGDALELKKIINDWEFIKKNRCECRKCARHAAAIIKKECKQYLRIEFIAEMSGLKRVDIVQMGMKHPDKLRDIIRDILGRK